MRQIVQSSEGHIHPESSGSGLITGKRGVSATNSKEMSQLPKIKEMSQLLKIEAVFH
jgi:hypothetical protein